MNRSADEQARRLRWLFPRWIRADRGEEALGVVLDQVPPGADRLPVRSQLDLVRAGLHARRRATPPASVWIEVLLTDARNRRGLVPEAWRAWIIDWLSDPHWRRRYVAATVPAAVAILLLLSPFGAWEQGGAGSLAYNLVLWSVVLVVMQFSRAARWRYLMALRNGMVPSDLRPFPRDATTVGVVRPLMGDRPALGLASAGGVLATALLAVNLGVMAAADSTVQRFGSRPAAILAAVQITVVLALLIVPTVRRIGRIDASLPAPPDPERMVERARTARTRAGWVVAVCLAILLVGWSSVVQGLAGTVMLGGISIAAWVEVAAVVRRQRRLGRTLTMWEVWPSSGPQPFLLVRQDVLHAEGLNGPLARSSRPPGSMA